MSATTLTLTIELGVLDARSSWMEFESLAVAMSREVPLRALEETLGDAQERLIDSVCGPRWVPVRGLPAPFACPRCEMAEDFARKGRRTRKRKLHTAAGTVELVLWNVGCRECGRVFAPLLVMLGLSGKRRTDRLTVDLAELGTQVSFARAAELSRQLAGTTATPRAGTQRAGRYRSTAGRHRRHPGTRALGPGRGDAGWHRRPHRDEQKRCGGAPGTGADRPLRAGRAAPGAHPPTRAHRRCGLARDGHATGRAARPSTGRARRRDRTHHPDPTAVADHPDPTLLVAFAPRTAQGLLLRRRRQPPRSPPTGPATCPISSVSCCATPSATSRPPTRHWPAGRRRYRFWAGSRTRMR